jgi:hypothetical protein
LGDVELQVIADGVDPFDGDLTEPVEGMKTDV